MKDEVILPDYGELMTLQEFIKYADEGYMIDHDGYGFYSDGRVYWKDEEAVPSRIKQGFIKHNPSFRYVIWFNK